VKTASIADWLRTGLASVAGAQPGHSELSFYFGRRNKPP
jgi:hypothetical protein